MSFRVCYFFCFIKDIIVFYHNKIILDFQKLLKRRMHLCTLSGACSSLWLNLIIRHVVKCVVTFFFSWYGACQQYTCGFVVSEIFFFWYFLSFPWKNYWLVFFVFFCLCMMKILWPSIYVTIEIWEASSDLIKVRVSFGQSCDELFLSFLVNR
jgi:hypothetical protein